MFRELTGLILLGLALVSCSEDLEPPPEEEVFSGELAVANIKQNPPYTYFDTGRVIFKVEGGTYKLDHLNNIRNLCSSEGTVIDFGTNVLTLIPTAIQYSNCDTLRIPQGEFKSIFRHDSLYLGPDTQVFMTDYIDTMIYHFRLTK